LIFVGSLKKVIVCPVQKRCPTQVAPLLEAVAAGQKASLPFRGSLSDATDENVSL
jgi:hypothetical protein